MAAGGVPLHPLPHLQVPGLLTLITLITGLITLITLITDLIANYPSLNYLLPIQNLALLLHLPGDQCRY